jgi:hypothetical protein
MVANRLLSPARNDLAAGGWRHTDRRRPPKLRPGKDPRELLRGAVPAHLSFGADLQYVVNPADNRDRGPVLIFGLRLHADF